MTGLLTHFTLRRAWVGLFAIALAIPLPAHAQRNPPTIPTRLAAAMLGGGYGELGWSPRFVVGHASADWPRALLPGAPWTTLGAVEMGPLRILVLDAPRDRDAMGEYLTLLPRAGLREIPWTREGGGFAAAAAPGRRMYCNDSSIVMVVPFDSTVAKRSLIVQLMRGTGASCGNAPPDGLMSQLDIPPLAAPSGVSVRRSSSSKGGNYIEQVAQLDTTVSVVRVLDHYAQQLAAAGWTVGRPLVDGGTGLQRLSARDKQGAEWQGLLLAITTGSTRQLSLRMAKPEDERR